ncbi:hypothetical protein M9Y10_029927 [Tritrichomonas musculus]|uniref:Leucine rich repeat protein n=1 Tax=Tritrichomonas musculus TaxID=1915356 RepID=A0ABR2KNG6_9EUKA
MAFANCHNLKRIEFNPDSELQKIKEKAFYLSPIQSISFPPKLTKIGTYAFFIYSHIQIIENNEYSQIKNALKNNLEALFIMIPKKKEEGTF